MEFSYINSFTEFFVSSFCAHHSLLNFSEHFLLISLSSVHLSLKIKWNSPFSMCIFLHISVDRFIQLSHSITFSLLIHTVDVNSTNCVHWAFSCFRSLGKQVCIALIMLFIHKSYQWPFVLWSTWWIPNFGIRSYYINKLLLFHALI